MTVEQPTTERPEATLGRDPESMVRRLPALDGIRAVAIVLILFFHAGFYGLPGGFYSVDIFFVLSGFLITGLLIAEHRLSGGIGLKRFWGHRIRRLLPAMLALLVAIAVYARFFAPADELSQIRSDALSTLFYANNWHQAFGATGYFAEIQTPRLLLHTWTLSIEEQFYLVWPLIVLGLLRLRRGLRPLLWFCVVGTAASAVTMAVLYRGGAGAARVYYGTDTRAQALLIGATLAVLMAEPFAWRRRPQAAIGGHLLIAAPTEPSGETRRAMVAAGALGIAVLLVLMALAQSTATWPYIGGFAGASIGAALLIASVVTVPDTPWAKALSLRPVRYVGAISYGLYLWHWPVFVVVVGPEQTGLTRWPLFAVRIAITFVIAAASFRFLEMPIRRRRLRGPRAWVLAPLSFVAVLVLILVATIAPGTPRFSTRDTGLSPQLHARLVATGAYGNEPVRFMLFGDSMAVTLRRGLRLDAQRVWGIQPQFTHAELGCDLDPSLRVILQGVVTPATPGCIDWPARWTAAVNAQDPEVVGILLGRWEALDHELNGHWTHVGEPLWDAHLTADLDRAVAIVSARGAKVILFTMPYLDPPKALDGTTWPENTPARTDAYNTVVRAVAAAHPSTVSVYDLNHVLGPDGHYVSVIDGITMRWADGIHLSKAAGMWLRPRLYPFVDRLAMANRHREPSGSAQRR